MKNEKLRNIEKLFLEHMEKWLKENSFFTLEEYRTKFPWELETRKDSFVAGIYEGLLLAKKQVEKYNEPAR